MRHARLLVVPLLATLAQAQQWQPLDGCLPFGGNVAFDRARGRAVLVGQAGEVWELDGTRALHRAADAAQPQPGIRLTTTLAFDEARRHVLMFGGNGALNPLGDTWTWDGQWRQPFSLLNPPRRTHAAITWDTVRQRVLMFGGHDLFVTLNDTWEHDGSQWIPHPGATMPPLTGPRMAFDRLRGTAVLVGFAQPALPPATLALFEWNGTAWLGRATPGAAPPPYITYGFSYDEVRGRCVLVGGGQASNGDVWEWDGVSWSLAGNVPDFAREAPATWFDPSRGQVVVAGGRSLVPGIRSDAWTWNGTVATRLFGERTPPHFLTGRSWCWSPGDGTAVSYSAMPSASVAEVWAWDGIAWALRAQANAPPARWSAAVTADGGVGRMLLFGGTSTSGFRNDLWSWDGLAWTALPSVPAPAARAAAGLAFDDARGVAVLFGGSDAGGMARNDTWEWNGAWSQRLIAWPPSARSSPAMAFDVARSRTVLFGGLSGSLQPLGDTWEWDGSQWSQVTTPLSPVADDEASMAWDRARSRIVLLTGQMLVGPTSSIFDQSLWDYDGVNWTLVDRRNARIRPRIVYDERRQRLAGYDDDAVREWSTTAASVSGYGSGCGPAIGLTARTRPRVGDPGFGLEVTAPPSSPVLFGLGTAQANVPIGGGCSLLIGGTLASMLQFAAVPGLAVQPIALPLAPALRGLTVFAQAGALDPVTSVLSLSPGLRVTVGD